jgi:hypothetical protein
MACLPTAWQSSLPPGFAAARLVGCKYSKSFGPNYGMPQEIWFVAIESNRGQVRFPGCRRSTPRRYLRSASMNFELTAAQAVPSPHPS